jgi:penicillin-binding protein 1C
MKFAIALSLICGTGLLCLLLLPPEPSAPSFVEVRAAYRPSDAILLDRSGEIIHEVRLDFTRRRLGWAALSAISPALQKAVIASEDRRFSQHRGIDGKALLAAGIGHLLGRSRGGASTISMQLATLLDSDLRMSPEGRKRQSLVLQLWRKWQQMQLAWALERQWAKAEILEAYLNLVPFRGELEGVAAAAHVLLGKTPQGISETEALVLAVLLRAPNAGQDLVSRRALVLQKRTATAASPEEIVKTITRALDASAGLGPRVFLASHVASRLLQPVQTDKPIRSTLDVGLQRLARATLRHHLLAVRARRVQDGAVLVADNATGEVLAYVGSSGDLSRARYVDGVRARRQAGSTLKPFLYGLAFEQRLLTPASLLEDTVFDLAAERGLYRPQNYDRQFRGLVSVRTALGASLNIPAVRTLELLGTELFVQQLRQLGFAGVTQSGDYYGPALALGSAEVSLWELVNAYRTLANGGVWSPLYLDLDKVQSAKCKVQSAKCKVQSAKCKVRDCMPKVRRFCCRIFWRIERVGVQPLDWRMRLRRDSGAQSKLAPARTCETIGVLGIHSDIPSVYGLATSLASRCGT